MNGKRTGLIFKHALLLCSVDIVIALGGCE